MAEFKFSQLVHEPMAQIQSAALLDANLAQTRFTMNDIGKLVVLSGSDTYRLAKLDENIEGFIAALSPTTVNNGVTFGSVQKTGRFFAITEGPVTVGAPVKVGTSQLAGVAFAGADGLPAKYPLVKATTTNTPSCTWRVISTYGIDQMLKDIPPGTVVLVERI